MTVPIYVYTYVYSSYMTFIGVHEMHGRMVKVM